MTSSFFPIYASYDTWLNNHSDPREFHGVPVEYNSKWCWGENAHWCYYYKWPNKWTINVRYYEDELHLKNILTHEVGHHFYFTELTYKERQIWRWVSEYKKFESVFNRYWITENCYVSEYSKTNDKEDFAEIYLHVKFWYKPEGIQNYCDVKKYVVIYFLNKYDG